MELEEVRKRFSEDRFATEACGCEVLEAADGHAVCAFDITPTHRNAMGAVMGGAIFTLADFCLAIASNLTSPAVTISSTVEYMASTRGTRLVATCDAERVGRTLGFYTTIVRDDLGVTVARTTATCYRIQGA